TTITITNFAVTLVSAAYPSCVGVNFGGGNFDLFSNVAVSIVGLTLQSTTTCVNLQGIVLYGGWTDTSLDINNGAVTLTQQTATNAITTSALWLNMVSVTNMDVTVANSMFHITCPQACMTIGAPVVAATTFKVNLTVTTLRVDEWSGNTAIWAARGLRFIPSSSCSSCTMYVADSIVIIRDLVNKISDGMIGLEWLSTAFSGALLPNLNVTIINTVVNTTANAQNNVNVPIAITTAPTASPLNMYIQITDCRLAAVVPVQVSPTGHSVMIHFLPHFNVPNLRFIVRNNWIYCDTPSKAFVTAICVQPSGTQLFAGAYVSIRDNDMYIRGMYQNARAIRQITASFVDSYVEVVGNTVTLVSAQVITDANIAVYHMDVSAEMNFVTLVITDNVVDITATNIAGTLVSVAT
ncbi:MAG: hypothetical protein Q8J97_16345, partial [Flavobacteriaceae bacterium]|nr:hypothetical protein [Flavobacteriaceae bacterium]